MFHRRPSLSDLGLPPEHKVLSLAYHELTGSIVAHVGPILESAPKGRLYFRWTADTRYQPIIDLPDGASIDSFVLDLSRPALFFLTSTYTEMDAGGFAGNPDALYRFDMEEHRCERLLRSEDLVLSADYDRGWVCTILGVSADGRAVFCWAGQETQPEADRSQRVEYSIVRLELATGQLTSISPLVGIFA